MNSSLTILFYFIICFCIIYLIHHLYNYLKIHFTKPIIKDFVHAPKVEYAKISSIINQGNLNENPDDTLNDTLKDTLNDTSSNIKNDMQDELKRFMLQELDE
jgi:hypothetical protein